MVATVKTETPVAVSISSGLELTADHKALTKTLATLARIADRKSSMPMLANVAIKVGYGACTLVATDLTIWLSRTADWHGSAGDFAVPAKQLADIVKGLSGPTVKLSKGATHGLRIESGGVDTTLIGMPGRDFPKVPSSDGVTFVECDAVKLRSLLDRVLFSVCLDETRFHLNGVYLETDGDKLRAVSTDGHRLTLAQDSGIAPEFRLPSGMIVPAKAVREISKLIQSEKATTCRIGRKDHMLFVKVGNGTGWELAIKTIDAQFPPYWQVIPMANRVLVTVERKPLIAALKRSLAFTASTRGVRFDVAEGSLKITCDNPDAGNASESLAADAITAATVGANPKYLIQALDEMDGDKVTLSLGTPDKKTGINLDPILMRDTEHAVLCSIKESPYLSVVMPMRI